MVKAPLCQPHQYQLKKIDRKLGIHNISNSSAGEPSSQVPQQPLHGCCCLVPLPGEQLEEGMLLRRHSWNLSPFQIADGLSLGGGSCTPLHAGGVIWNTEPASIQVTLWESSFCPLGPAGSTQLRLHFTGIAWFATAQRKRWWWITVLTAWHSHLSSRLGFPWVLQHGAF